MASRERISHLGVIIDAKRRETVVTQERCRKFYGAVNSVVAQLGGVSRNDKSGQNSGYSIVPNISIWKSLMGHR